MGWYPVESIPMIWIRSRDAPSKQGADKEWREEGSSRQGLLASSQFSARLEFPAAPACEADVPGTV